MLLTQTLNVLEWRDEMGYNPNKYIEFTPLRVCVHVYVCVAVKKQQM